MPADPVSVDTSGLRRKLARLAAGLGPAGDLAARRQAEQTAKAIADRTPVRTGALRSTVGVTSDGRGFGVTYGGGLPYANYIDHRTDAVEDGVDGAHESFKRAVELAANHVIGGL